MLLTLTMNLGMAAGVVASTPPIPPPPKPGQVIGGGGGRDSGTILITNDEREKRIRIEDSKTLCPRILS